MADIGAKFGLSGGGSFNGIAPPPFQTGKFYWPHFLMPGVRTMSLTANRLYRTWFYVSATTTFLGGWARNSGVGDSGVVMRVGVWNASGVLKKDFGVITLGGAAATNTAANSVTLAGPAWYQVGLVTSGTPAMNGMGPYAIESDVGIFPTSPLASQLGAFAPAFGAGTAPTPIGDYAAFTYGALPDPITTATTTIFDPLSNSTAAFPAVGLYL